MFLLNSEQPCVAVEIVASLTATYSSNESLYRYRLPSVPPDKERDGQNQLEENSRRPKKCPNSAELLTRFDQ